MSAWRHGPLADRRSFLRGAGALVALPWLPSLARGADAAAPQRLVFVMWENGAPMDRFTPDAAGAAWGATPCLDPLVRHRGDLAIWTGLSNRPAMGWQGGGHSECFGGWLTTRELRPSLDIENDISVDQAALARVGAGRVLPSLQVSLEKGGTGGTCPALFPCAYDVAVSWAGKGRPLAPLDDAGLVFDRLFPTAPEAKALARRRSVLDLVREDAAALAPQLASEDAHRLDEWLEGIRHVELRLQAAGNTCGLSRPEELVVDDAERADLLFELIATGLACDATRVVTLTLGRAASERALPGYGAFDHHTASHHRGDPNAYDAWTGYTAWCTERVARLLDRMAATDDHGARLLDHSLVVAGSCMGEGQRHVPRDLPLVTAGSLGGLVGTGSHHVLEEDRPLADLWLGLLHTLGDDRATFGDDGTRAIDLG